MKLSSLLVFSLIFCFNALSLGGLNDYFIENKGQFEPHIKYKHSIPNGELILSNKRLVYQLYEQDKLMHNLMEKESAEPIKLHGFSVDFIGANPDALMSSSKPSSHYFNYFIGENKSKWKAKVYGYEQVNYQSLYAGIHLKMYHQDSNIKYDFIVEKGGDPMDIKLAYNDLDNVYLDDLGRLHLVNTVSEIIEDAPIVYQIIKGKKVMVKAAFILKNNVVSYSFPDGYDKNHVLTIDPTLIMATYSGATGVLSANCTAYDLSGNIYVGSGTLGNFPVTAGAYQTVFPVGGIIISCIQKFDQAGNVLYATYIGGGNEYPLDMSVNTNDQLILLTYTSGNFPMTASPAFGTISGGIDYALAIFNTTGTNLLSSTYLGGSNNEGDGTSDVGAGIFVNANNEIFVGGSTLSGDFPVSAGSFQTALAGGTDGTISKFNSNLSTLIWSTYIGGTGDDIVNSLATGMNNDVYFVGNTTSADFPTNIGSLNQAPLGLRDGFIGRLNAAGTALVAATYIGTTNDDRAKFISLNAINEVFVGGSTVGSYPISAGTYAATSANNLFIHKLDAGLINTLFSTQVGCMATTQSETYMTAFGIDYCDKIYFTGAATGNDFPTTADAYSATEKGLYMAVLTPDALALDYGSFFGGNILNQHFHPGSKSKYNLEGILFHSECTFSNNYPTTNGTTTQNGASNDAASFIFDFEFSLPLTDFDVISSDTSVCTFPFSLSAASAGNINVAYLWSTNETTPSISISNPGTYSVEVYNDCDTIRDTIVVTTISLNADFTIDRNEVCKGEEAVLFTTLNILPSGTQYEWEFGDGQSSNTSAPSHVYTVIDTMTVKLTVSLNGCSSTVTKADTIIVHGKPTANFSFSPDFLTIENTVAQFINTSSSDQTSTIWNFGNQSGVSNLPNPTYTYPSEGGKSYAVTLEVSNIHGCTDDIIKYIEVQDVITFYIPNSFTPNDNTGENSIFDVEMTSGVDPYQFKMLIFNRWGEILFQTEDFNKGWDGRYLNEIVKQGAYIWKIEFKETMSDKKHIYEGHVTVLR
ncbi:hypothetical protein DNU06_06555 [Putridiphycobacter roseus]|uniref:PKD domain-containing protein n=1 Tax=Putridiphycobacter roseus TaxID=2219161 RepID=A0A2W1N128_9FLAO|nr:PKD domain-containing protein [Putridiphycobacter roseus]PZE17484.1 hypothetical protein DNU06_06555 [Putridiphycobacter roseus]